jgi:glycosyltransferase involved in cell wall biosynthesis
MKKVLIVTDAWAPQVNGVTRVLEAHVKCLEARGYEVVVAEPGQFFTLPMPGYSEIPLALFARRKLARIMETASPDAIHIATEGPLGWAARRICLRKRIPFTTWYHTKFQLYVDVRLRGLLHPVHAWVRRFHQAATRTMVSTNSLKRELEADGFKNVVVVPLGVDTELFSRNPSPPIPALPTPVFVYFSRLAPEKSPEEFLALDLPGTKLVVGDGPDRKKLEKKYGDKNTFVGYKYGKELVDWLSLANVCVFPSRTETFGLIALEALACGIPVAAHDVMGPRDLLTQGVDGYLSEDLREGAMRCLDLEPANCRATALTYSWDRSTDLFIENLAWK